MFRALTAPRVGFVDKKAVAMSWRKTKAFETFSRRMLVLIGFSTGCGLGLILFLKKSGEFEPLMLQRLGYDRQSGSPQFGSDAGRGR